MKMKNQIVIQRKFNQNWIRSIGLSFLRDQKRREEKRRGEEEEEKKKKAKKVRISMIFDMELEWFFRFLDGIICILGFDRDFYGFQT